MNFVENTKKNYFLALMNLRKIENYASIIPKPTLSENANLLFLLLLNAFWLWRVHLFKKNY